MSLRGLNFSFMAPEWDATTKIATAWFPELAGSIESRLTIASGRELLRAFLLLARMRHGALANMEIVRQMLDAERRAPDTVYAMISELGVSEAANAVSHAARVRGAWFGDPLPFLLINIVPDRAIEVARRWPVAIEKRGSAALP